ncbi:MAG: ATP-dependent sacrificial sulfur transferase LarE [Candidatus Vecturithrix sp.]|jgi:uncharacterized protein|nr:ATP-dependent sacrificial sulfur transferase LarE [Candidatus Vecturithrix sp.]
MSLQAKYERLQQILREMKSALAAFSGGVDSTLLAKAACDALGEHVQAVTAWSERAHELDEQELKQLITSLGIRHHLIRYDEMEIPHFRENPPERCYYCKRWLFERFTQLAKEHALRVVIEGSNLDDADDFRPGMRALKELGVRSPLREAGLTKQEIRTLSQAMALPTWNKPAMPCLATRVPYYLEITPEVLRKVQAGEAYLKQLGFREFRVRHHDTIARIELPRPDMLRIFQEQLDQPIIARFKEIGYAYITLDLQGFRSGSLNEVL